MGFCKKYLPSGRAILVILTVYFLFNQCSVYKNSEGKVLGLEEDQEGFSKAFELPPGATYLENRLIIQFKNLESPVSVHSQEIKNIQTSLLPITITSARQMHPDESDDNFGLNRFVEVQYTSSKLIDISALINDIKANDKGNNIGSIEPNYTARSNSGNLYEPNDFNKYYNQSYLETIGATKVWEELPNFFKSKPAKPTIVAIIDSGGGLNHPDLQQNIHVNKGETPDNDIDDDKNGYIDDYYGWDFAGAHKNNPQGDKDPDTKNTKNVHGVHVAGLVSAVTNNGEGIASVAHNYAKLLIVKVTADDAPKGVINGYEGVYYAVKRGAEIINCSWGGPDYGSLYAQNIINYALSQGCLIVAAAGNDNMNKVHFPACHPGVLAVANVTDDDEKYTDSSNGSNYGERIDISAPGVRIYSTIYNNYDPMTGTSMSAPIVSSAAALVKARFPEMNMQQVAKQLKATAKNIDNENPNYAGLLGTGRLNVYDALTKKPDLPLTEQAMSTLGQNFPNPAAYSTTIPFTIIEDGQVSVSLYTASGKFMETVFNQYLYRGTYKPVVYLENIPAGMYFYQITHGNTANTMRMLIYR